MPDHLTGLEEPAKSAAALVLKALRRQLQSDTIDLFERRDLSLRQPGTHRYIAWVGQKTGARSGILSDPGSQWCDRSGTSPGSCRPCWG